jgi:hypothetical protein
MRVRSPGTKCARCSDAKQALRDVDGVTHAFVRAMDCSRAVRKHRGSIRNYEPLIGARWFVN